LRPLRHIARIAAQMPARAARPEAQPVNWSPRGKPDPRPRLVSTLIEC
jgi:hypothetical protein